MNVSDVRYIIWPHGEFFTLQDVVYQMQRFFGFNSLCCLYNPFLWTKEP